jgi:hypothetical protein
MKALGQKFQGNKNPRAWRISWPYKETEDTLGQMLGW